MIAFKYITYIPNSQAYWASGSLYHSLPNSQRNPSANIFSPSLKTAGQIELSNKADFRTNKLCKKYNYHCWISHSCLNVLNLMVFSSKQIPLGKLQFCLPSANGQEKSVKTQNTEEQIKCSMR